MMTTMTCGLLGCVCVCVCVCVFEFCFIYFFGSCCCVFSLLFLMGLFVGGLGGVVFYAICFLVVVFFVFVFCLFFCCCCVVVFLCFFVVFLCFFGGAEVFYSFFRLNLKVLRIHRNMMQAENICCSFFSFFSTVLSWRLGGGNSYTGEVMVDFLNITGRICPDGWDDTESRIACQELGFAKGSAFIHYVSPGSAADHGPYWTSRVACSGIETSLADCPMTTLGGVATCSSPFSAGLQCFDTTGNHT